jgi:cytochrome c-type biogenesis protein
MTVATIADAGGSLVRWWGPALAFLAGVVSFASPCVLPLVPGYLSFVMGESAVEDEGAAGRTNLLPVVLFIAGFTLVFVLYGAFAHQFVQVFKGRAGQLIAGVVIALLGLFMIGYALRRGSITLYVERRPFLSKVRPGTGGAFPLGMAFAAGWTPCIGPVLGAITIMAASQSQVRGALLMLCYALGLGLPFLVVGLGAQWLTRTTGWLRRHYEAIAIASGSILVVLGWLVATGRFTRLIAPLVRFSPSL